MNIEVIHSVSVVEGEAETVVEGEAELLFQWCRYPFEDGDKYGYRFIWRTEERGLHTDRGQARIPSAATIFELMRRASEAGWFVSAEREQS